MHIMNIKYICIYIYICMYYSFDPCTRPAIAHFNKHNAHSERERTRARASTHAHTHARAHTHTHLRRVPDHHPLRPHG